MRLSEIPLAPDVEQILDAVEIEEEGVAAAAGKKRVIAGRDDIWFRAEGDLGVGDDLLIAAILVGFGERHQGDALVPGQTVIRMTGDKTITVRFEPEPFD